MGGGGMNRNFAAPSLDLFCGWRDFDGYPPAFTEHYVQPFEGIIVPSLFAGLQTGAQPPGSLPDARAQTQGKVWTPRESEACLLPKCLEADWLPSQPLDASDFLPLKFVGGDYVPLKHQKHL